MNKENFNYCDELIDINYNIWLKPFSINIIDKISYTVEDKGFIFVAEINDNIIINKTNNIKNEIYKYKNIDEFIISIPHFNYENNYKLCCDFFKKFYHNGIYNITIYYFLDNVPNIDFKQ